MFVLLYYTYRSLWLGKFVQGMSDWSQLIAACQSGDLNTVSSFKDASILNKKDNLVNIRE